VEKNEVLRRIGGVFPALRKSYGLRSIALFGFVARGEARPGSDIDLLVEFEEGRI